jgi:hypothetical protein
MRVVTAAQPSAPTRPIPRPRGGGYQHKALFTLHCDPNGAFALNKGGSIFLIAFRKEQEALEVALAVEHHLQSLDSWPDMKVRNGVFHLYGEPGSQRSLNLLRVKKWVKRDELVFFAAVSTLHLGIVSFAKHEADGFCLPFDAVPIKTTTKFYSHVFDNIYEE